MDILELLELPGYWGRRGFMMFAMPLVERLESNRGKCIFIWSIFDISFSVGCSLRSASNWRSVNSG